MTESIGTRDWNDTRYIYILIITILFLSSCSGGSGGGIQDESRLTPPASPSGLRTLEITENQISLAWNDTSDDEGGFEIERSDDGITFQCIYTNGPDASSYTDTGLLPMQDYYYRIRAVNNGGASAYSNSLQVTTLQEPVAQTIWNPDDFTFVYDVGPGHTYDTPSDVPWENLQASTLIRIHYRTEPYRDKWVITTTAAADAPLVVTGIPDNGRLPVISGDNAVTRSSLYYLNQVRSVIKIGNYTSADDSDNPAYVYLENLDIRTARPGYYFTDTNGHQQEYNNNAAAVHIEDGLHVTIKNCRLHDCGNAIMSTYISKNIRISSNHIYDNGIEGSYYEHNTYTESQGIIYEYNHFGPLRSGCGGNNLKDRSSGTVIRYNWIESGNRQLDLVDSDHEELYNSAAYDQTFVYGNILVEPDGAGNSQIIHYGGDSSNQSHFRRGTLYLYHNTIVSKRSGNTTLIRLSTDDVTADIKNNIIYTSASPGHLALTGGHGIVHLSGNWLTETYRDTFESTSPDIRTDDDNITGTDPGFINYSGDEYQLSDQSDCLNNSVSLTPESSGYPVNRYYIKHQSGQDRTVDQSTADIGAFERDATPVSVPDCNCSPLDAPGAGETIVTVDSLVSLQYELSQASGPTTLYLESGVYSVTPSSFVVIDSPDITLRSLTGNREDVIIMGEGMSASTHAGTGHGIYILADNITIADLTIQDTQHHGVFVNPGSDNNLFHNIRIIDTGEQLFKASGDTSSDPKHNSIIQCSSFEYTTTLNDGDDGWYTNGIDLLNSHGWVIRDNTFKNIRHHPSLTSQLSGPAILVWRGSSGTRVERNRIMDCDFGISFGNAGGSGVQHRGGIIMNNIISGYASSDFGIGIIKAENALVINNTIYSPGSWPYSIEARFSETSGTVIMNNLADEPVTGNRDGASSTLVTNITDADSSFFTDTDSGDFSLSSATVDAVDSATDTSERTHDAICSPVTDGMPDIGAREF